MKIGLYFGTFNPIHIGHLIIANHFAEYSDLEQIWLMVTPHNPLKQKNTLLNDQKRLNLAELAVEDYPKIKVSDFEFKLPQPNYTVDTLAYLSEKYPQHEFALIMGEDNLNSFHKWKNYETILNHYQIFVYPRINGEKAVVDLKNHASIKFINAPIVEISSTFIRQSIKDKKNVQPLLPQKVWDFIDHNNLYKK
jgi:nicotinate-nucleotide adenylyltransferase